MGYSGYLVTCLLVLVMVTSSGGHCPSYCPAYNHPVCGSNGKTYYNDCELQRAACRFPILGLLLKKVHDGPCGAPGISVSVVSGGQCGGYCHHRDEPVCGSDGNTYPSECRLKQAACRDRYLTLRHRGPCDQTLSAFPGISGGCNNYCSHHHYNPVCGSDGRTYNSDCELRQAACRNHYLRKKHDGPCGHPGHTGHLAHAGHTNYCNFYCAKYYDPVCGSDGRTYNNECWLRQAACSNRYLTQKYRGTCGRGKDGPEQQQQQQGKPVLATGAFSATGRNQTTPAPSNKASTT